MNARACSGRACAALCLAAFISAALANGVAGAVPDLETIYTAVVRRVTGDVRMSMGEAGQTAEVKIGDVPDTAKTFTSGPGGFLELRFHPDMMTVEMQAMSRVDVAFSRTDSAGARRIRMHEGRVTARTGGAPAAGANLLVEDGHFRARVRSGRVAFVTGREASTILVLEGEAEVLNLKTGAVDMVRRGGKAVAGQEGTTISRAGDGELAAAGLRQNRLEVDFWNPATEEYRTLEIEYEGHPRKP